MSLSVGIVGLPNVGKSTLFNALVKKEAALAANYPFATIDPNTAIVDIPDNRLNWLANMVDPNHNPPIVPATITFVDIAGLVKGASKGEGLGNQFLSHIREANMIVHVLRDFNDPDIIKEGTVSPKDDSEIVETELILKDLETLQKRLQSIDKRLEYKPEYDLLKRVQAELENGKLATDVTLDTKEIPLIQPLQLLTFKPILYVFNKSEEDFLKSPQPFTFKNHKAIPIAAKLEAELIALNPQEQMQYLKELGLQNSALDRVIKTTFELLNQCVFLTAGVKEVRAWNISNHMRAQNAAGVIHTDFIKKFIKAEVIAFEELQKIGSIKKAHEMGKIQLEGKEYIVKDGDVITFKIGA